MRVSHTLTPRPGRSARWIRTLSLLLLSFLLLSCLLVACGGAPDVSPTPDVWVWDLPPGFPEPVVPEDNPMRPSKVTLGRALFYDTRLSGNQTYSCGSCHQQALAFTDGLAHAEGSTGELHRRSSMGLTNVAYNPVFTWVDPNNRSLEMQALGPMFGTTPVELGLLGLEEELIRRLREDSAYQTLFPQAFPDDADPFTLDNVTFALAAFERTLISGNAPYDRYVYQGDRSALSASAQRGLDLFFTEKFECYHCHGTFNFSDTVTFKGSAFVEVFFSNTGLYNLDGAGAYPEQDQGLIEITGEDTDMGFFRAPTLRNIALTAPYMHDGSIDTLDAVLEHYAAGGRTVSSGENSGVGSTNPYKSEFVRGFTLTEDERQDMLAFLNSLTDDVFITDARFSDPSAP